MPSPATLFSVKIVSPRDVEMEAAMACDVIRDWNSVHALSEKIVLLPLAQGNAAGSSPSDVLIAFLHAAPGAPIETGTMEQEIGSYLERKRPVFVYFSEARVAFARSGECCEGTLQHFKERYAGQAVVDSFNDEKEFRAKFAQQLEATLRSHPGFNVTPAKETPAFAEEPKPDEPKPAPAGVSELAQKLLIEACADPEAYIGRFKDGPVLKIQANGQQFVEQGNPAAIEKWEAAFNELLGGGHIRDAGCHGRLFQISAKGFEYLKTLGHAPVGYIAELGSV
jgi:hypothetical protein